MARYTLGTDEVIRKKSMNSFTARDISSIAPASLFLEEPYHFILMPKIHHRVVLSPYTKDIDIYHNKDFTEDQIDSNNLGDDQIIDIANTLMPLSSSGRNVKNAFLIDGKVIIYADKLLDTDLIASAEPALLELLVSLTVGANKKSIEDYLILTDAHLIKNVHKDAVGKMFIPHLHEWFDEKFPGLMVGDDAEGAEMLTMHGFKLLLSAFVNSSHGQMNLEKESIPKDGFFSIDIKEYWKSSNLSTGLSSTQIKPLTNFLRKNHKELLNMNPTPKGLKLFAGKNVLTSVVDERYDHFETVTWPIFRNHLKRFPVGCSIVLAPGQIIVDKDAHEIFGSDTVHELYYKGPEATTPKNKNTIEVLVVGDSISRDLVERMRKYFKAEFNLPINSFSTIKNDSRRG